MALIRLPKNLGSPMAFYLDITAGDDVDLTTIVSATMALAGPVAKQWVFVPVVGKQSATALTMRHDFVEGDTDAVGDFRCTKLSLATAQGGSIPIITDTVVEIADL